MIEKGRHEGLERNLRYCPVCLKNDIFVTESEFHFFVECALYEDIRKCIFGEYYFFKNSKHVFYRTMARNETSVFFLNCKISYASIFNEKNLH